MAAPHVAATLALIAEAHPAARGNVDQLVSILKGSAQTVRGNATPPLSASDVSPADLTGVPCSTGYCHLGGAPISNRDAYGAGLVDAARAVAAP
jgi:hypothetical protein